MATVDITQRARQDLRKIHNYYAKNFDATIATDKVNSIAQSIFRIAANPMLNRIDYNLATNPFYSDVRFWLTDDKKYRIYYDRLNATSIRVLRVWAGRRPPLKPDQL